MLFSVDVYVTFTIVMILLKLSCSLKEDSNASLLVWENLASYPYYLTVAGRHLTHLDLFLSY